MNDIGGRPLAGRRLLMVVPEGRESYWSEALVALGAGVVAVSLTRHEALSGDEARPFDDWLRASERDEDVVLTSGEGVRRLAARAGALGISPAARLAPPIRVTAIGPATAEALAAIGRPPDRTAGDARAEGVLATMSEAHGSLTGRRIAIVRAVEGRSELPDGLAAAGALVRLLAAYRTVIIPGAADAVASAWREPKDRAEAAIVTSGAPLSAMAASIGERDRPAVPLVALGPVTAEAARALGFRVAAVATAPSPAAVADAVVRTLSSR